MFQADPAFRTMRAGLRVTEVPIKFVERELGDSKMSRDVATESLKRITRWGLGNVADRLRRPCAGCPRAETGTAAAPQALNGL